jgi:hypothetical protein
MTVRLGADEPSPSCYFFSTTIAIRAMSKAQAAKI